MTSTSDAEANRVALWQSVRRAAWLSVAVHLVAGLAMVVVLCQGLDTNPQMDQRLRFLHLHEVIWQLGWCTWNLAALAMLYFVVCFRRAHHGWTRNDHLLDYAMLICAAAVPLDLAAEGIEMAVLPELARDAMSLDSSDASSPHALFNLWHRTAVVLTGFLANGLYTVATILLVWSTRRIYPIWIILAGGLVGIGGIGLSGAALADSVQGMVLANVVLVPAILTWQIGVAITRLPDGEPRNGCA